MAYTKKAERPALAPAIVDEIGDLERELKPLAPKQARLDALRKLAREAYEHQPGVFQFEAPGTRYVLVIGARGQEHRVNVPKLIASLSARVFAKLATVTLKAMRENCTPAVAEACTLSTQTGPRSLKVMEKGCEPVELRQAA